MTQQRTPEQQHRRQVRRQIAWPMLGAAAALIVVIVLAALALGNQRLAVMADFLSITCILMPLALVCLIPTLLLLALGLGAVAYGGQLGPPLAKGRASYINIAEKVRKTVPLAAGPVTALQTRLAYWETILTGKRAPAAPEEKTEHGN